MFNREAVIQKLLEKATLKLVFMLLQGKRSQEGSVFLENKNEPKAFWKEARLVLWKALAKDQMEIEE